MEKWVLKVVDGTVVTYVQSFALCYGMSNTFYPCVTSQQ